MLAPRKSKTLYETPEVAIDLAISMACITAKDTVVDIGCGRGAFVARCAASTGARCVGVEIEEEVAAEARTRVNNEGLFDLVRIVTGNALELHDAYKEATGEGSQDALTPPLAVTDRL